MTKKKKIKGVNNRFDPAKYKISEMKERSYFF